MYIMTSYLPKNRFPHVGCKLWHCVFCISSFILLMNEGRTWPQCKVGGLGVRLSTNCLKNNVHVVLFRYSKTVMKKKLAWKGNHIKCSTKCHPGSNWQYECSEWYWEDSKQDSIQLWWIYSWAAEKLGCSILHVRFKRNHFTRRVPLLAVICIGMLFIMQTHCITGYYKSRFAPLKVLSASWKIIIYNYGKSIITPNMYLHCHMAECVKDYGSVYGFWCFSYEWYNGILGSFPTN